jgi:filamentous hemagglutinin family protein
MDLSPAQAQIIAAPNDAGTQIQRDGNTFTINGGTRAGANLFHSFQEFGLTQGQIAAFRSQPAIRNILGRVTGGDASIIDGMIRVTGGNSNLYLLNPAGVVFGANARLDVPAAFTATTASAIGLGDRWFNAVGRNDYAALVGTPDSFAFTTAQPGAIFNGGTLVVGAGQSITLLGGAVLSTGTLRAPAGTITVLAVPGERLLRVTQSGSLLSLDLPIAVKQAINSPLPDPLPLAALLTGGTVGNATGVTVENGVVRLTGSGVTIPTSPGNAVISGTIDTSSTLPSTPGGKIYVLGDRVGLFTANLDASGSNGGGTILIGGDYRGGQGVPSLLSPSLNASRTFVNAGSTLRADAWQWGNGGRVIVWADGATQFDGSISVRGGAQAGNGGFVEVSGRQSLRYQGKVDASAVSGSPGTVLLDPVDLFIRSSGSGDGSGNFADGQILAGELPQTSVLLESALEDTATVANIRLEATNDIVIEDLPDDFLTIPAPTAAGANSGSIAFIADADADGTGQFRMNPGDTILTSGRTLTISGAAATIGRISTLRDNNPGSSTTEFLGGEQLFIGSRDQFASAPGTVDVRFPDASSSVAIAVAGDLEVQRILAGDVFLSSQSGSIRTGSISSEAASFGPGSQVVLQAPNGSVLLQGFIRSGQTNKTSDSTIAITAVRFRATTPLPVIETEPQTTQRVQVNGVDQTTPTSLFAYPRDVDAGADNSTIRRVGTGQFVLQFQDQTPLVTGTGNPLITIQLLQDTNFSIGRLDATGSGMEGAVSLGAERAPSAIVLLRDNLFAATVLEKSAALEEPLVDESAATTATILEQERSAGTSPPACDSNVAQGTVLNLSAILPDADRGQSFPANTASGLPPCTGAIAETNPTE